MDNLRSSDCDWIKETFEKWDEPESAERAGKRADFLRKREEIITLVSAGADKADAGDHIGGLEDFSKAVTMDPSNRDALYLKGRCELVLNQWAEAERDIQRVLELYPGDSDALESLEELKRKRE